MAIAARRTSSPFFWLTLVVWGSASNNKKAAVVEAQNNTNTSARVCQGVGDALYKTDWERQHNPCGGACQYDSVSRTLSVECRYDYCKACDPDLGFCGVRVIQINNTLTEASFAAFVEQQTKLDLGSTKKYCIAYSDGGALSNKFICIDVDNSFNTNCAAQYENLPYGLPLLTCDETVGCQCAVSNGKTDKTSPFIGFEKLKFDSCYVEGLTTSSAERGCLLETASTMLLSAMLFFLLL